MKVILIRKESKYATITGVFYTEIKIKHASTSLIFMGESRARAGAGAGQEHGRPTAGAEQEQRLGRRGRINLLI